MRKLAIYGQVNNSQEEWLADLTISDSIATDTMPAEKCILEALKKCGCEILSVRRIDTVEHELL